MNKINKDGLVVEFQINNFKSYFGDQTLFEIAKPITIIAGPNGEGKTNLLEAMLVGLANFVNHSRKLKRDSLFTKHIKMSSKPEIYASLYDLIFTDYTQKGLAKRPSEVSYPERLDPRNIISHRRKESSILVRVLKYSDRGQSKLAEMTSSIVPSTPLSFQEKGYLNKLEHLELFYLNPDTTLNDAFVKLVGQEFSNQLRRIRGTERKASYQRKIFKVFPRDENRLICDIEGGEFEEKYVKGMNFFLTSNLATGAKKECLLYILGMLVEEHKKKKNWLTIFLVDEIGEGLHMSRQKILIDALINTFQKNEEFKKHIKIVMTTHSPIIYSELMKYPDYVDAHFVLRNPGEPSKIFQSDTVVDKELIKKRVLADLGLNIYELPRKVVFVEGKTDTAFWGEILKDVRAFPLRGASIPEIILELITHFPLARSKEYLIVVDKSGYDNVKKDIKKLKDKGVDVRGFHTSFNSLEELIFGVNIDIKKLSNAWNKIEKRVEELNKKVEQSKRGAVEINIKEIRKKLEKKGKDGLKIFFKSLKNKDDFYKVIGKDWPQLLEGKGRDKVKELKSVIEG